jgi:isochorismate pyruvate lyase
MPTPELRALRQEIDGIDQELAALLARRFRVVDKVIALKKGLSLPALLPDRVEEVVENARKRGETLGVPADSMEKIWRLLVAETISYEETRLND